jgi:CheY-like chemotaxis protein
MRVLYVEDNDDFANDFVALVRERFPSAMVVVCSSFSTAVEALVAESFDLALIDLSLPRESNGVPYVEIGVELFRLIESTYAGTPVVIFTGQEGDRTTDDLRDMVSRRIRFFGGADRPFLSVKRKDRIERLLSMIDEFERDEIVAETVTLSDLDNRALGASCSVEDRRLLRSLCVYRSGARGRVKRLSGGMSGSAVYRVDVISSSGATMQRSVGKLGIGKSIEREHYNYESLVSRLQRGYPAIVGCDLVAGGARRAIFYNLAEGVDSNFFALLHDAREVIEVLRARLAIWHGQRSLARETVEAIVAEIAGAKGVELARSLGLPDLNEVFELEIEIVRSVQHGDLHGANILCNADGSDVCLIDFGDVRETIALLDAVSVELSPLFHPEGVGDDLRNCLKQNAAAWFNDADISRACPGSTWLSQVRPWIRQVALSHVDYAVTVLAYAIRQLKYEDTDKDLAVALINAAVQEIRDR